MFKRLVAVVAVFSALLGAALSADVAPAPRRVVSHVFDIKFTDQYRAPEAPMPRSIFPAAVEITKTGPVLDQGKAGSCGPNAAASLLVWAGADQPSRLFIYYETRARQDNTRVDEGVYMDTMFRAISESGYCAETSWPYDLKKLFVRPTWEQYREAEKHIGTRFRKTKDIKAELAAGHPVVVGVLWYAEYLDEQVEKTGDLPAVVPGESEGVLGGHAIFIVGYNDRRQRWVFKNSWGLDWGEKGYGTLPYDTNLFDPYVLDQLK